MSLLGSDGCLVLVARVLFVGIDKGAVHLRTADLIDVVGPAAVEFHESELGLDPADAIPGFGVAEGRRIPAGAGGPVPDAEPAVLPEHGTDDRHTEVFPGSVVDDHRPAVIHFQGTPEPARQLVLLGNDVVVDQQLLLFSELKNGAVIRLAGADRGEERGQKEREEWLAAPTEKDLPYRRPGLRRDGLRRTAKERRDGRGGRVDQAHCGKAQCSQILGELVRPLRGPVIEFRTAPWCAPPGSQPGLRPI